MQKKTRVHKVTTGTENHRTECLIFPISNKNVIEDKICRSWYLIFTRIDKLKVGCSNNSEALSWTNYNPVAILGVPINPKMLCDISVILYHNNQKW